MRLTAAFGGVDLGVLEILPREHDMDAVAHLGPDLLDDDWEPHVAAANDQADRPKRSDALPRNTPIDTTTRMPMMRISE